VCSVELSLAKSRAAAGRAVIVATPDNIVGNELSRSGDLAPANARLQQAGVRLERRTILRSVKKGAVEVEDRFSGERRTIKAAAVVDCGHRLPDDELFRAAVAAGLHVVRAGDDVAPRTVLEAVREARATVLALDGAVRISDGVPMAAMGAHH
jgi:hypothetical protein